MAEKKLTEQDIRDVMNELSADNDKSERNMVMYTGQGGVENMAEQNPEGFMLMYVTGSITCHGADSEAFLKELYEKTKLKYDNLPK